MEVLQTSALPLGDGAGWNLCEERSGRVLAAATTATGRLQAAAHDHDRRQVVHSATLLSAYALRASARQPNLARRRERRLERETGFEPATSTLARSHSTTELFPLATKSLAYHSDLGPARRPRSIIQPNMPRIFTVVALTIVSCAVLAAAEFWESKPFLQWSDKEVEKVLTD